MSIAGELLDGVGFWLTRNERKRERDDAAVKSVLTAVNSTKRYLARKGRGEGVDRNAEAELVQLWTDASVHIRRTDPELSNRLQEKAEYWTNPENWSPNEVSSNEIQINSIAKEARRLLTNV